MINMLKVMWFKWLRHRTLSKVETLGIERIYLKEKQLELKERAEVYLEKTKELKRLTHQD